MLNQDTNSEIVQNITEDFYQDYKDLKDGFSDPRTHRLPFVVRFLLNFLFFGIPWIFITAYLEVFNIVINIIGLNWWA